MSLGDDIELKVSQMRLIPGFGDYDLRRTVSKIYYWSNFPRESNRIAIL